MVCHGGTGRTLIRSYLGLGTRETMDIRMRQDVIFHLTTRGLDVLETGADMS